MNKPTIDWHARARDIKIDGRLVIDGLLHLAVERLARLAGDRVSGAASPVGAGGDDDPAIRIDEDALAEDALGGDGTVIIGPPLKAIAPARIADIGLLGMGLYFLASTDFGLNTGWLDMSSYDRPITRSLYLTVLNSTDSSPLLPLSDEENLPKEEKKADAAVSVKIDPAGIQSRIVAIDIPARNYTGLAAGPEGTVFYMEAISNEGTMLKKYDLKKRKSDDFMPRINQVKT